MDSVHFSHKASVFHGRTVPEEGSIEGYAAIINAYKLKVPIPDLISLISTKNRKYKTEHPVNPLLSESGFSGLNDFQDMK